MQEIISIITNQGQITLPAEIRKHLGIKDNDKLAFAIDNEGNVLIRVLRSPSIALLRGAAGSLKHPLLREQIRQIAYEDCFNLKDEEQG